MAIDKTYDVACISRHFQVEGTFLAAETHGSGHINHSFLVSFQTSGSIRRYLLQRVNSGIFKAPALLMENIQRVTSHLAMKMRDRCDLTRSVLTLILSYDMLPWHQEADGSCWRMFRFIEGALTYDSIESAHQAFEAAKAFGNFQQLLADLPAPRLHETIPHFHDTPGRFLVLEQAIERDAVNRAVLIKKEIEFVLSHKTIANVLLNANLPERVTHNDTKLNNVLFDTSTNKASCVVDLDTVMPGLALYDFGDLVRTATSPTQEDEQDLTRVTMQLPMFEALVKGYLGTAGEFLTSAERSYLPFAGKLIAFEQAIRFLTDYLSGDVYYKIARPGQNLDRCRTQLKMVESVEHQEEAMHRIVASI